MHRPFPCIYTRKYLTIKNEVERKAKTNKHVKAVKYIHKLGDWPLSLSNQLKVCVCRIVSF